MLLRDVHFVFVSWYLVNSAYHAVPDIVPKIGHFPVERILSAVDINTLRVIMTDDFNFVISLFVTINIWQFKTFDFIIFTNCKLNIELNEHIFMNICYSVLLKKLVIIRCSLSVLRNFFSMDEALPYSECLVCWVAHFSTVELDHEKWFNLVFGPFEGMAASLTKFRIDLPAQTRSTLGLKC